MIKIIKIIKYLVFLVVALMILVSCNKLAKLDDFNYEVAVDSYLGGDEVWVLQPQTIAQSLGIAVKTKGGELIIFDGGRKEDADCLYKFIKRNGGKVSAWFLSHIHDDHAGAIYEIMDKHKDIKIENLYYNFADFDFYYSVEGDDAGIALLLLEKFGDLEKYGMKIHDKIKARDEIELDDVKVEVMNDIYLLAEDGINNSSIIYKVYMGDKSMIVLGDLSLLGGESLLKDRGDELKSDIVVLAHHGRGGVGEDVYRAINPEIVIWPSTEKIYNSEGGLQTRAWFDKMNVKKEVLSFEGTYVIK